MPFIFRAILLIAVTVLASCANLESLKRPSLTDIFSAESTDGTDTASDASSPAKADTTLTGSPEAPDVVGPTVSAPADSANPNDRTLRPEDITATDPLNALDENLLEEAIVEETDLLSRIRAGFQLDLDQNQPEIEQHARWYAKNQTYLDRVFARSEKYLFHIVEEVERRNMPLEIALLPVVESAFDPFAYSHGRAAGLWQFIPSTGKMYGLEQNWWYDGRRGVIRSTNAALRYLGYLSEMFDGNWQHALASYNAGEGTVLRAIKKNKKSGKETDFWSLKLPKETSGYVPKLLAIARIIRDPQAYGVQLPIIANEPYFDVVDVGSQIDLAQAAKLAEIDIKELYQLNPAFNRWATSPLGPHNLIVPLEKAEIFRVNLANIPEEQRLSWQRYKIQSGDSLIRISKKFNTTPDVIRSVNRLKGNNIRAGKTLLIPVASKPLTDYDLSAASRLASKQSQGASGTSKITYTVKSGDNFWDISRKYGVSYRKLAKWNGMAPTDPLKPGQTLVIWSKKSAGSLTTLAKSEEGRGLVRKVRYNVRSGDSLARIAGKFRVKVKDIVSWNNINPRSYLQPGQRLTLYVDITSVN